MRCGRVARRGRWFRTGVGRCFGDHAGQVRRPAVRRRAHRTRGPCRFGNTLVRTPHGWRADNTDIDGVAGALGAAAGHALVLGSGGTAPAAVVGLAELGVTDITVVARNSDKAARLVDLGTRVGVATRFCAFDSGGLADAVAAAEVLVSTIPAEVAAGYAGTLAAIPVLLDAIYDPWPTPLAAAVGSAGGRVISGLQMLLHQAFAQVEQFTGLPAPREAMTCALAALD